MLVQQLFARISKLADEIDDIDNGFYNGSLPSMDQLYKLDALKAEYHARVSAIKRSILNKETPYDNTLN